FHGQPLFYCELNKYSMQLGTFVVQPALSRLATCYRLATMMSNPVRRHASFIVTTRSSGLPSCPSMRIWDNHFGKP
ncbi:MAG: hypothetical protein M0T86_07770, partial [Betaproteobacteria bacterium]|nr:hypothetical protein [Betaproteobacteria bacterium]